MTTTSITSTTYTTDTVTSADGTTIGYKQLGSGPGLLILPAGTQSSQHYMRLATALSSTFTISIVDRRGRPLSGPHGSDYSIKTECDDVAAVIEKTGAHYLFGHSSSALIALQAALTLPHISKIALFEPPLSTNGSISTSWIPQFDREIAQGHVASALITFMKADNLTRLPRWLLLPLLNLYLKKEAQHLQPHEASMQSLIPTQRFDGLLVKEMDNRLSTFSQLSTKVLLLGGSKSPSFLQDILTQLHTTLPHSQKIIYPDFNHSAPTDQGKIKPAALERLASDLQTFFTS